MESSSPPETFLFSDQKWSERSASILHAIRKEIADINADHLLITPTEDLCDHFAEKYRIDVPKLLDDTNVVSHTEVDIDVTDDPRFRSRLPGPHFVRGTEVTLSVDFVGDGRLFKISPNAIPCIRPSATIGDNKLFLRIQGWDLTKATVEYWIEKSRKEINQHLQCLSRDTSEFEGQVRSTANAHVDARRAKVLKDRQLVASLGYPLKPRSVEPGAFAVPTVRRKLLPNLHQPPSALYKPEHALENEHYEHILHVLQQTSMVIERAPSAFIGIKEETLRFHFLIQLNGHYEGQATGETFNGEGKTDILVRVDGRNIFIGECKFWKGAQVLTETIDQLLSYSSWRDTKVALLIFNRNKGFSSVLLQIEPTVRAHPNFKRNVEIEGETRFRFILSHKDDASREMIVTVLAFDIPT